VKELLNSFRTSYVCIQLPLFDPVFSGAGLFITSFNLKIFFHFWLTYPLPPPPDLGLDPDPHQDFELDPDEKGV
jgi:hypothetical protein